MSDGINWDALVILDPEDIESELERRAMRHDIRDQWPDLADALDAQESSDPEFMAYVRMVDRQLDGNPMTVREAVRAGIQPDLFARSVAIEHAAESKMREIVAADPSFDRTVIGLGRNWTWESVGNAAVAQCQLDFYDVGESLPCGCHDGGDEDDDD